MRLYKNALILTLKLIVVVGVWVHGQPQKRLAAKLFAHRDQVLITELNSGEKTSE